MFATDTPVTTRTAGLPHPSEFTVERALAYVADTESMRTPSEKTLAREVTTLRAMLAGAARREADARTAALIADDTARRATLDANAAGEALGHLGVHGRDVARAWEAFDPDTLAGQHVRMGVQLETGPALVAALDAFAEVV